MQVRTHTSFPELLDDMGEFARENAGSIFIVWESPAHRTLGFCETISSVVWEISLVNFKRSISLDAPVSRRMATREGRDGIAEEFTKMSPPLLRLSRYEILASDKDVV